MKTSLSESITEIITANPYKESAQTKKFIRAGQRFDELVKKGIIIPRGYTLMTIDQEYLHHSSINSPSNVKV